MGVCLALSLLITVVGCQSTKAEESVDNFDRIITVCSEEVMEIHLRKDYDQFSLKGAEPECAPTYGNFTDYDGTIFKVKTWTLPLTKGNGPCGLSFVPVPESDLWKHATTIYGPDKQREAHCVRPGVLDKRGAEIRLESLTPDLAPLKPAVGESTVEVLRRSTISAYFHHRFPQAASLSLHPISCWIINERRQTKRLVVAGGCPIKGRNGTQPLVVLGSESASKVTGDLPHLFFNAEPALLEDEDPSDLPSFRLQCTVMPCKGSDLFQQVIGVARCPAVAKCQDGKRMSAAYSPADMFEVNQEFSLTISASPLPAKAYRPLRGPIYPGEYWFGDSKARAALRTEEMDALKAAESEWPKALCFVLIGALITAVLISGCWLLIRLRGKAMTKYVREKINSHYERYPSRNGNEPMATELLVGEEIYKVLTRHPDRYQPPSSINR